jgi:hypothetical protein
MPSAKKCKICREPASVKVPAGHFCSIEHVYQHARNLQDKAKLQKAQKEKRKLAERKVALKSRSEWLRQAQAVFNQYIRLRDKDLPCISCQRHHQGQYHAGHYLTVGARPELRFNENNLAKQCSACNLHLSGNLINYRINLIKKIGLAEVEMLEGPHDPLKLSIDEIKALIAEYREKIKKIK